MFDIDVDDGHNTRLWVLIDSWMWEEDDTWIFAPFWVDQVIEL